MARGEAHPRLLSRPRALERVHEPADLLVDGGDLPIVLRDVVPEVVLATHGPPLGNATVEVWHQPQPGAGAGRGVEKARVEWRGRRVRRVGIDVMQPEEE